MDTFNDDSLSDIEQYYGFDFKFSKSPLYKAHQANRKKLIIFIGLFLVGVTVAIMFLQTNNSLLSQLHLFSGSATALKSND